MVFPIVVLNFNIPERERLGIKTQSPQQIYIQQNHRMGNDHPAGKITLAYWPIAGRAQPARYTLALLHADWQDKVYMDRAQWFENDKKNLGFAFPNLPYLIDGNVKITESAAVLKYIPKRFGREDLLGKTAQEYAAVETVLGVVGDIWTTLMQVANGDNWKSELGPTYDNKIKDKLVGLEKNVVGPTVLSYLTIADLAAAPVLDLVFKVYKDKASEFKKLQALINHVHSIPEIQKYRETGVTLVIPPNFKLKVD